MKYLKRVVVPYFREAHLIKNDNMYRNVIFIPIFVFLLFSLYEGCRFLEKLHYCFRSSDQGSWEYWYKLYLSYDLEVDGSFFTLITVIELYEKILGEKFEKADLSNINERIKSNVIEYLKNKS